MNFTPDEISKIQSYLRSKFANQRITLMGRKKTDDSVEVLLDGEFIGVIYKTIDEGETSFDFNMAILDIDLE